MGRPHLGEVGCASFLTSVLGNWGLKKFFCKEAIFSSVHALVCAKLSLLVLLVSLFSVMLHKLWVVLFALCS